jgi:hypothetical protein
VARRRSSQLEFSMFPFLSVLCTVIGVLILLIVLIISNRTVDAEQQLERAKPPPLPPPVESPDETKLAENRYDELRDRIDQMTSVLNRRKQELDELRRTTFQLEELIASKKHLVLENVGGDNDIVLGVDFEEREDVEFVPLKEDGFSKKPRFIEVRSDEFVLQPGNRRVPIAQLTQANLDLKRFLIQVDRNRRTEYVLILIHPNGASTYYKLLDYIRKHHGRLDIGKEPFSEGWVLLSESTR